MINNIKEAFNTVKADEKMKSDIKIFLNENSTTKGRQVFSNKKISAVLVCGIICICLIIGNGFFRQTLWAQAAYVELSGPAQIGFSLDKNNKVIDIIGLNENGQAVAESVDAEQLSYYDALDKILNSNIYQECVKNSTSGEVTVIVECDDKENGRQLKTQTHEACQGAHKHIRDQQSNQDYYHGTQGQDCEQDYNINQDTTTNTHRNGSGRHHGEHH